MSLQELMKKHGSVGNIPDAEARAAGFEKVREGGGWRLRKLGEDPLQGLRKVVAANYGLGVDVLSSCDGPRLRRLLRVSEEYADREPGEKRDARSILEEDREWRDRIVPWARACAARTATAWFSQDPARQALRAAFPEIDADVWFRGLDPWVVDVTQEREVSPRERIVQAEPLIRRATADLLAELVQPDGLLKEAAAKLGCPAQTDAVLTTALADEDRLRAFLAIAVARSGRKGALKGEPGNGHFHVRQLQKDFSERQGADASGDVFRFQMAAGDLFADIDIGNDAGCCLGVYLKDRGHDGEDDFGEGFGKGVIPSMLIEPSVRFVAIYRGKQRMGLILLFLGREAEGDPILVCNSIELSGRFESWAGALVDAAVAWIDRFRAACHIPRWAMGNTDYNTGLTHGSFRERGTVPVAKIFIPFFAQSDRIHADVFEKEAKDFRGADIGGLLGVPTASGPGAAGAEGDIFAFIRAQGGFVVEKPGTLRLSDGFRDAIYSWAGDIRKAIAEIPNGLDPEGLPRFLISRGYGNHVWSRVMALAPTRHAVAVSCDDGWHAGVSDVARILSDSSPGEDQDPIRIVPLGVRSVSRDAFLPRGPDSSGSSIDPPDAMFRICAYALVASIVGFIPEVREEVVTIGDAEEDPEQDSYGLLRFDGEQFTVHSVPDACRVAAEGCDISA